MKRIFVLFSIVVIFTIYGCATQSPRRSQGAEVPKSLDVATNLKFEDVPMPSGFKILSDDSFIFDNDITRLGILKYTGSADPSVVVKFYREQMPLYNWRFINLIEFNMRIINFDRDDQTCIIIIEPRTFGSLVTVSVAPKSSRASTYKAKEK